MGCVCSKQVEKQGRKRERTISVTNHMVALTSSTLGVLDLGPSKAQKKEGESEKEANVSDEAVKSEEWAEKRVTEVESAPMTINAWELMQGLDEEDGAVDPSKSSCLEEERVKFTPKKKTSEEDCALDPSKRRILEQEKVKFTPKKAPEQDCTEDPCKRRSLGEEKVKFTPKKGQKQRLGKENGLNVGGSGKMRMKEVSISSPLGDLNVNVSSNHEMDCRDSSPVKRFSRRASMADLNVGPGRRLNSKIRLSMDLITEPESPLFSPQLVATLEKALEKLSEEEWNFIRKSEGEKMRSKCQDEDEDDPLESFELKCPPGGADAVVLYTTTLRGIRKTFEECNNVRDTLASYGICVSERDVSMHLEFRNELRKVMGKLVTVPRLFIKGRYIGGAEEVVRIHEEGQLGHLLRGIRTHVPGEICDGCGGVRFVPCLECSGSCKLVNEENKVVRCPECNENGLIQCPICC